MGGVFRVTDGLQKEFGPQRVFDTPISEAGMAGAAVGLAFAGWRSVIEMEFDAFSYPALEQVIDHVAKMRERTRGRVDMPITIRIPSFGGIKGKEHHGESPETYYVHTAGLKVVVPSSALDAYRLLRLSIADPDPVIFLEPKARYWSKESGELTTDGPGIGQGRILHEGDACTLISYGSMVSRCVQAAEGLDDEGIGVRVVDLRSLSPLDDDLLALCARETGRVVVVHEAPRTLGMGAEIAARIMELAFDHLQAPVARVTGWDTPYPPASLEDLYLPSVERITDAIRKTVNY
jgi:pyruvate dehydrogenase E1 component beta subunit